MALWVHALTLQRLVVANASHMQPLHMQKMGASL